MLNVYIEKEGAKHDTLLRWQSSCAFSTVNDCRYEKMKLQSQGNLNDHMITPWWQRCIAISNAVLYHFLETCKLVKFSSGDMCLHLCGAYLASGRLELWGSMEHFLDLQGLYIAFFSYIHSSWFKILTTGFIRIPAGSFKISSPDIRNLLHKESTSRPVCLGAFNMDFSFHP